MIKAIILSRVSTQQQKLEQQTQEVSRKVYKDKLAKEYKYIPHPAVYSRR